MKEIASELEGLIDKHVQSLHFYPEEKLLFKPLPAKWSKKEVIGHLVDSAQSNIRRFVVSRYEDKPNIVYNQDKWVQICNYQEWVTEDLVNLWYLLNRQICMILRNTPDESGQLLCQTQEEHTLEWLAKDYIKHLKHHLHQVLELEPVAYP